MAEWWYVPSDALPYVLHFEALEGLQKQGGGELSPEELAQLRSQPGRLLPAAGAAAAHDPVALLSVQVQNLTVQHTAVRAHLATQGVTLLQCSSALQQHGQVLQRHEAGIMANRVGLLAQQDWNDQMDMRLARQERGSQLADAGAWAAAPASLQLPTGGPGSFGGTGLEPEDV